MNIQLDPKVLGFKETDRGFRLDYGDSFFGFLVVDETDIPLKSELSTYTTLQGRKYALYDQAKCDYVNIRTMFLRVHKYGQEAGINSAQRAVEKALRNTTVISTRIQHAVDNAT